MESKKFTVNKEEAIKILKVFGWTAGSAGIAMLIAMMEVVEFPIGYAFLIPLINTVLYAVKEWMAGK